jgi:hypothetical protein
MHSEATMEPTEHERSPHIWDAQHVKLLLLQPTALLRTEPFASWIGAHGGLASIYKRLTAVRLPPKLFRLRALLLAEASPPPYDTLAWHLGVSRKTVYRHLERLALELASALNALDGAIAASRQRRSAERQDVNHRRRAGSA